MKIGIIGGSGLDDPNILDAPSDFEIDTPYGPPNSTLRQGKIGGKDVVLLARHGRAHTATPTHVNYRANIHALRKVGCAAILSTTAVGSLRQEIGRGDLVILDQFIDFTKRRHLTFHERFEPHNPAHTPMADPFSEPLRQLLIDACRKHASPRLVYVSSMSVFDHAGRRKGEVLTEDYRYEPHSQLRGAYTQTKLTAEEAVHRAIVDDGLPAVILRPGQIFGPGAEQVTPNGTIALAGRWVAIGSGSQPLPLVYRDDVVDALLLAAESPQALGRTFNLVDTDSVDRTAYLRRCKAKLGASLKTLWVPQWVFLCLAIGVELLGKVLKRDVPLTRYRVRSLRPLANFDVSAARDVLGWTPRVGVKRGLDITFGADKR